jgi:hypothetical protein
MMKIMRRLLAVLAFFAVLVGALKSLLNWVSRSGDDDHEVFADDDLEQV